MDEIAVAIYKTHKDSKIFYKENPNKKDIDKKLASVYKNVMKTLNILGMVKYTINNELKKKKRGIRILSIDGGGSIFIFYYFYFILFYFILFFTFFFFQRYERIGCTRSTQKN